MGNVDKKYQAVVGDSEFAPKDASPAVSVGYDDLAGGDDAVRVVPKVIIDELDTGVDHSGENPDDDEEYQKMVYGVGNESDSWNADIDSKATTSSKVNPAPTVGEWDVVREQYADDYNAAMAKKPEDRTLEDDMAIFRYENEPPKEVEYPEEEDMPEYEPGAVSNAYENDTWARLRRMREANGDTPEQKLKRAKAYRASRLVAAIGDVLQGAANMWAASKGAKSAKLTSIAGAVSEEQAKQQALELKRAKQYAEELDAARKADDRVNRVISKQAMDAYRAKLKQATERNAALRKEYAQKSADYRRAKAEYDRRERDVATRWHQKQMQKEKERVAKELEDIKTKDKIKVKTTPGAKAVAIGGSGSSGGGKNSKNSKNSKDGGGKNKGEVRL